MVAFLSVADIDEQRNELIAKVEAIVENAKSEDRELSADEVEIVNDINDDRLPALDEKRATMAKIEKLTANKVISKVENGEVPMPENKSGNEQPFANVRVPARARMHGRLRAFEDNDRGEKEAYVTGRWFAANFLNHGGSDKWLKDHGFTNAMSGGDNDQAGVLVPVETSRTIIRLVEQYGVVRRFMSIEPMGSDRKVVPVRVSGMTAYPVAETNTNNEGSNTGTQSNPTYKNIELVARTWKAWCKMSDQLNEDAFVDMGEQIAIESAQAFAYAEDNAGFNGDSTSTHHGITGVLNAVKAGSIYTAATGNTAFSTLDLSDFETMVGQLPDYPGIDPAWFISKEGYYASMHPLMMAAGGNTTANYENGGGPRFLGLPVVFTNVLNKTLTAQVDTKIAVLGDLRMGAKFGDRRMMTMSTTDQRYWDEDQIAVKATERFDINVHSTGTASEAGAILVLQTPSS